jgi:two-component system sensor histidine kinase/response regulator
VYKRQAKKLRELGYSKPIVAVTASALKGELERCLACGMNGILTKPFTLEALGRALGAHFESANTSTLIEPAVFHFENALAVFLGNRELLIRMLARFHAKLAEDFTHIAAALPSRDLTSLRSLAHAIKGSALNLTAQKLGNAASVLELACAIAIDSESPDWESLTKLFHNLTEEGETFIEATESYL